MANNNWSDLYELESVYDIWGGPYTLVLENRLLGFEGNTSRLSIYLSPCVIHEAYAHGDQRETFLLSQKDSVLEC